MPDRIHDKRPHLRLQGTSTAQPYKAHKPKMGKKTIPEFLAKWEATLRTSTEREQGW